MAGQQRQERMRGGGGDDFEAALVLKFAEGIDEIAVARPPGVANQSEPVVIHPRQFAEGAVPVSAVDFLFRQFDEAVQVPFITPAQQRVEQHRAQGGRERKCQRRAHAVAAPAFERLQQRQVGFRDGFKQPGFLQKLFVLGMPHKRQVRVQHQGQISLHSRSERCRHSSSLFEIHSARESALNKATTPDTTRTAGNTKSKIRMGVWCVELWSQDKLSSITPRPINAAAIKRTSIKAPRWGASMKVKRFPATALSRTGPAGARQRRQDIPSRD